MSRIGKKPVPVPAGVEVKVDGGSITVKGKQGELSFTYHPAMAVEFDSEAKEVNVTRPDDERQNRALHGLTRALIANMVQGVETPFVKKLEIQGVGYQASLNGQKLSLQVGFANTIVLDVPQGVNCELPNATNIVVSGPDKHMVGQFAANIRSVRPPEPYKGKGIRYEGEYVRRKAGKAFAS
ncbi:50S ribosomal protein L6 [Gimesia panareensis]|uniref:Large ribosomal subunit protein uL6 n=1 Tax=Gimesia panareensis TaxID=2527978 RepID=A0A518FXS8_9PLAN|nr:50S ribosomal protein L6 [Gimesia panareensis]QDV21177.1 50S ribosomal protein L6 [Gimesia panareensis]